MTGTDPRLLEVLDEPVALALRDAAADTPCHLVGGLLRDRLLGVAGSDFDAVVEARGRQIGERLARDLPARLVHLGGKAFAAYRLAGDGFTLDIWDRQGQELHAAVEVPEWGGQTVRIMLEEDAFFDGERTWYIDGRQTELWLIPR